MTVSEADRARIRAGGAARAHKLTDEDAEHLRRLLPVPEPPYVDAPPEAE